MSRSHWIAGLAVGLIITLSGWYGWHQVRIYQIEKADQRQSVAETDARNLYECFQSFGSGPLPSFATCLYETVHADADAQRADYDLQAQQEMAVWAYAMFISTIAVIAITTAAAGFAWQQVIESRRIGEAQTRAYLAVEKINLKWIRTDGKDETLQLGDMQVTWRNDGTTPARRIGLIAHMVIIANDRRGQPIEEFTKQGSITQFGFGSLGSHDITHVGYAEDGNKWLSSEQTRGFIDGSLTLVTWTCAKYMDIFDREHTTEECSQAHYFPSEGDEGAKVRFSIYPHHNKSD